MIPLCLLSERVFIRIRNNSGVTNEWRSSVKVRELRAIFYIAEATVAGDISARIFPGYGITMLGRYPNTYSGKGWKMPGSGIKRAFKPKERSVSHRLLVVSCGTVKTAWILRSDISALGKVVNLRCFKVEGVFRLNESWERLAIISLTIRNPNKQNHIL